MTLHEQGRRISEERQYADALPLLLGADEEFRFVTRCALPWRNVYVFQGIKASFETFIGFCVCDVTLSVYPHRAS